MFSTALKKLVPSVTLIINKREHFFVNIFDIALENNLVVQERTELLYFGRDPCVEMTLK